MREKLQTLPLAELKEMAKNEGIKGLSSMRKAEIIDLLCQKAEGAGKGAEKVAPESKKESAPVSRERRAGGESVREAAKSAASAAEARNGEADGARSAAEARGGNGADGGRNAAELRGGNNAGNDVRNPLEPRSGSGNDVRNASEVRENSEGRGGEYRRPEMRRNEPRGQETNRPMTARSYGDRRQQPRSYQPRTSGGSAYSSQGNRGYQGGNRGGRGYQAGSEGYRGYQNNGDNGSRGYQNNSDNGNRGYQNNGDNGNRGYQNNGDSGNRGYQNNGDNGSRGYQNNGDNGGRSYQNSGDGGRSYQNSGDGGYRSGQPGGADNSFRPYQNDRDESNSRTADYSRSYQNDGDGYYSENGDSGAHSFQDGDGERYYRPETRNDATGLSSQDLAELDSGIEANGILEVMPDGFGFIRCENFLPGENDVYVAPSQIRRFNLKTGDIIAGNRRVKAATEKFAALLYIKTVNGYPLSVTETRPNFEDLTPIFPNKRLHMESDRSDKTSVALRVLDLLAPIGMGQRGMIVSPPKAGKTTLLKQVAKAVTTNHPDMHLIILLIDERPEEVTDIREAIVGPNVEVIYSTFDELPERHKRVSEMVIERAKRLVEHGRDVIILLDSITRLARAYNLTVAPSGRTLSGGLDPAALYMPKRFFGAARNMREGGSLTILATALVDTGSRMDDVVYEEFKGTGNMELVLDRKLSEKRIFPAIDILKSGTRRDDLLLTREEREAADIIHKATNSLKPEEAVEKILDLFARTRNNREFVEMVKKIRLF